MKSIWHTQKFLRSFIYDKPRWRSWWTQMKIIKNTTIFWSSSFHQNVHPDFQVKACRTQGIWQNTIGHPTKAQHYLHHCKAYKENNLNCLKLLHLKLIITEGSFYLLVVYINTLCYLFKITSSSSSSSVSFSNIQISYKL